MGSAPNRKRFAQPRQGPGLSALAGLAARARRTAFTSPAALAGPGALLLALAPPLLAATLEHCRSLRDQRNALASRAMQEELNLVRSYRNRVCPQLHQQAEQANANASANSRLAKSSLANNSRANSNELAGFDYQALLNCRSQAEQQLERRERLLYRNRTGFSFYTAAGASLAQQADKVARQIDDAACQP